MRLLRRMNAVPSRVLQATLGFQRQLDVPEMLSAVDVELLTVPGTSRAMDELRALYRDLASCLDDNRPFVP